MMPDALGPPDAPDRFALVRRLGGGAMGIVFEAIDRATGDRIALKTLARGESRYLAELKREFRLVQSVLHPNLVRLGGLFQGEHTWFFTMELLEGKDFLTWVRGDGAHGTGAAAAAAAADAEPAGASTTESLRKAPDPDATAPLRGSPVASPTPTPPTPTPPTPSTLRLDRLHDALPQLGRALAALHAEGLVHRDVKPSNTLVTAEGRVVLLDFGLTRAAADDPHAWTLAGTPAYMAPEQAAYGASVTAAADCYAVGVMLYQALTGRLPFVGTLEDLLYQKRSSTPVPPRLLAPEVPPELEALCLRLLATEPELRPTAAELAEGTPRPAPRARAATAAGGGFVGREPELARIRDAFGAAGPGPTAVVVEGESGIGKTALLGEATRRFAGERALVLRGRCFEREVTAYPGVDMIMDAVVAHLRRLDTQAAYFAPRHLAALRQIFPTLAGIPAFLEPDAPAPASGGHEARLRAAGAFHELFARLATRHQLVLVIDDAQWLGDASLMLLRALLAADDPIPLVLLLAARGPGLELLAPWLDALACPVSRIALGPLSPDESLVLLRHHVTGSSAELAAMAHDSAGHPYLLRELALATGDRVTSGEVRVDDVLRHRAARLAPPERTVLDLVCASTGPVRQRVIGAAAGVAPGELSAITSALVRQRWAVVTTAHADGWILPAHDRVRGALGAGLDEPVRRGLARRLAEALEADAGDDVEALALQWSLAGDLPRAARFARPAGDRAMAKLAFERAASLYELALRGLEDPGERAAVLTAMAEALAAAGRGAAAAETYLRAAELLDGHAADDLVLRAADQRIRSGQVNEGKQLLARVLERLDIRLPATPAAAVRMLLVRRLRLRLRGPAPRALGGEQRREVLRRVDACWPVGDLLAVLDPLRAAALHTQGLLLALDAGEPYRLARSLCTEAAFVSMAGRAKRARALARLALAEQLGKKAQGHPQLEGYLALGAGVVHLQMGELDDAQRRLDHAEATFERCPGAHWETGSAREFALWTLAYRGHLAELAERLTAAVAICDARHDPLGRFKLLAGPSRVVLLARDEPHPLLEACELAPLGLSPEEYPFLAFCALFGRVNAFLYLGRAEEALAALDEAGPAIEAAHLLRSQFNRIDLAYLRGRAALARAGERAASERAPWIAMARRCARALRGERAGWADALAATLEALGQLGADRDRAIAALRESADLLAAAGLGGFASAARWQLRHALGGAGEPEPEPWAGAAVARPDRLAHTFAPLPVR